MMRANEIDEKRYKPRPDLIPCQILYEVLEHPLLALAPGVPTDVTDFLRAIAAASRLSLVDLMIGVGRVLAYGWRKHGECTWRVAGTEQADPQTHYASMTRHTLEYIQDASAVESGSRLPVLWHAAAQAIICRDLVQHPPSRVGENDNRWRCDVRDDKI